MLSSALIAVAPAAAETAATEPDTTPAPTTVVFAAPADADDLSLFDLTFGGLDVIAGEDVLCLHLQIEAKDTSVEAHIGTADQPKACAVTGVGLTILRGDGATLVDPLFVQPGVTTSFQNFAPLPAGSILATTDPVIVVTPVNDPPVAVHLVVWQRGSVPQLVASLVAVRSVWVTVEGSFVGYLTGAPTFVNTPFLDAYPAGGIPRNTPVLVVTG